MDYCALKARQKNEKNRSCDTIAIFRDSLSHAHARPSIRNEAFKAEAYAHRAQQRSTVECSLPCRFSSSSGAFLRGITRGQWDSIIINPSGGNSVALRGVDSRGAAVGVLVLAVRRRKLHLMVQACHLVR